MRNCLNIRYCGIKICLFLTYAICIWIFESNTKYFMPSVVSTEDVTTSSVRLIPYHSLLSSMFQPVSRRQGVFSSALNNILPSRRHRRPVSRYRRPPSRFQNRLRKFKYQRPNPYRNRYPTRSFNKYKKSYGRNRHPSRKPQNSFLPGGIVIDVQPRNHTKIQIQI